MNTIKVSDEHLQLIQKALELYIRCSIGQFERVLELPSVHKNIWDVNGVKEVEYLDFLLKSAHKYYTGSVNGGPGIFNKEKVTDDAREVLHIHDQIKHHLWKKSNEEPKGLVSESDAMIKLIEIE